MKVGSDDNHFNVSLIVRDKVTRQCPQTTTSEEKGEPKRIRTEVPLLTSLTPYLCFKLAPLKIYFIIIIITILTTSALAVKCLAGRGISPKFPAEYIPRTYKNACRGLNL